jgi:excisionase family DNA binding protein
MNNPPSRLPRLLTVDQAAQALGQSAKTIRRKIERHELPVHRIGRTIRIAEPDLLAYLSTTRA